MRHIAVDRIIQKGEPLSRRHFMSSGGLALSTAWLGGHARAEAGSGPSPPLQAIRQVAPGAYAAFANPEGDISANSGFVIGNTGVWIFDAQRPDYSRDLLKEIRKLTSNPVRYVIHSHHHREIVEGNPVFEDAAIVGHSGMRTNLIEEPRPGVRLPELTYEDQLTFYDGDLELRLIHLGRYHTDGDSVLYLPQQKVLFAGDLLPGKGGPGGMRQAFLQSFVKVIDRALKLDFDVLVPGRGDSLADKDDLRAFQAYLAQVLSEVKKFVDRGAPVEQALREVQVPDYIDRSRLGTESFDRLWRLTIERAYADLKGELEG